jgi:hypothetical protein
VRTVSPYVFIFFCCIFSLASSFLFWIVPLYQLDQIYTSYQDPDYSDQNFYLYYSRYYCESPPEDFSDFNVTWTSGGVVAYLTSACRLIGGVFGYLAFNLALFCVTFLLAVRAGRDLSEKKPIIPALAFAAIPTTLYYVSLPGKEILSISAALLMLASIYSYEAKKKASSIIQLLSAIIISGFNRPHEAVIFLFILLGYYIFKKSNIFIIFALLVVAAGFSDAVVTNIANPLLGINLSGLQDLLVVTEEGFGKYLVSENYFIHAALAPIRILYLILGVVFTSLLALGSVSLTPYSIFRDLPIVIRSIDFLFVIAMFVFSRFLCKKIWRPAAFVFLGELFFISFFGVEEKSRYIINVIPLLMVSFLFRRDKKINV